ncbi:hypothetical protein Sjap_011201 [Stephania japonica]|uniref:Uncharacterized protein n=1 Tax=Stephania japonica TaxID=461633 RepID=A0AAP0JB86_9MAGN
MRILNMSSFFNFKSRSAEIQRMREEMSQSAEEVGDDPPPPPRPPPRPSHQETLTPPMVVPTPALDANDVYHPRMYNLEDEEQTNLAPLQQEWIDAFFDTHPLPRPNRDI